MSEEWVKAKPMDYHRHPHEIGKVYNAEHRNHDGLQVREIGEEEFPTRQSAIVIELQDMELTVAQELGLADSNVAVLAFKADCARYLCRDLIRALTRQGDRVASKLEDVMQQVIDECREEEEE